MSAKTTLAAPKLPAHAGRGAASCSPSSWTGDDTGLPIIRTGTPFRCHGDAIIDSLRIARVRLDRTLKALRACAKKGRQNEERYDLGRYLDGVIDYLEDGALESMDPRWFTRSAGQVMECVIEAEAAADKNDATPEPETWKDFRELSVTLKAHGSALSLLKEAESAAKPSPVNVEPCRRGDRIVVGVKLWS